jgi:hypothetical protein
MHYQGEGLRTRHGRHLRLSPFTACFSEAG